MTDQKTISQLKSALAEGRKKEDLYQELLSRGLTLAVIEESFNELAGEERKAQTSKRAVNVIVTLGAILIAAGIFSFIAANWVFMSSTLKLTIIFITLIFFHAAGWYLTEKQSMPKTGDALSLLGTLVYGAGIFLTAQIFNIRADWPDGFILWLIGAAAVGFATKSHSHLYLTSLLGAIAVIGHPVLILSGENGLGISSLVMLFVATLIFLGSGWKIGQDETLVNK